MTLGHGQGSCVVLGAPRSQHSRFAAHQQRKKHSEPRLTVSYISTPIITHPNPSGWSVVFLTYCPSVSCLNAPRPGTGTAAPCPGTQVHQHPCQGSLSVWAESSVHTSGEHLGTQKQPSSAQKPFSSPKGDSFAMVITSVSINNHCNRVFMLYLLLFTPEDCVPGSAVIPVPAQQGLVNRSDAVPR